MSQSGRASDQEARPFCLEQVLAHNPSNFVTLNLFHLRWLRSRAHYADGFGHAG